MFSFRLEPGHLWFGSIGETTDEVWVMDQGVGKVRGSPQGSPSFDAMKGCMIIAVAGTSWKATAFL